MHRSLATLLLLAVCLPAFAQKKQVTLESIYDPAQKVYFSGAIQTGFDWIDETTFLWPARNERGETIELRLYDTKTNQHREFVDRAQMRKALVDAGLDADHAKAFARRPRYSFDRHKKAALIDADNDLYVYDIAKGTAARVTSSPEAEEDAALSPDGTKVGFTRDHNLFVTDLAGRVKQLTTDGGPRLLNGKLDWVYQEEVYGRGRFRAFWWSPDSTRLAFLQTDERPVHEFTLVDHLAMRQEVEVYHYPKAGDPNPSVKLFLVSASGGPRTAIDLEKYRGGEFLIVKVDWSEDSGVLTYQVQDREQRWLDLNVAEGNGKSRTLLRETTPAWVDPIAVPHWLANGTFLWLSERSGWQHIYHYKADGTLIRQVTNGEWEARELHAVDEKRGYVYYSGNERSPIGGDVFRIKLDGTGRERLSQQPGTHVAKFNEQGTMYVDRWSDIRTPDQARLHDADGKVKAVLDENRSVVNEYSFLPVEFLQIKTKDGFVMEASMTKPPNFDPAKKYPVYWHLYAGPHSQTVRNAWKSSGTMMQQVIASEGAIVFSCDNRTSSGKGAVSAWPAHKRLGESELADIEDAVTWLKAQPYVDGNRIMLNGWSYGGFMVAFALTHSKSFVAGIAGAPVTDWRLYDTIYTERYMLKPENNEDGYNRTSPRLAAKNLHGKLLLVHGTIDDNVHMQNTIQFAWELQKAGKAFELMLYPTSKHGVQTPEQQLHMQRTMLDFIRRALAL
jgi:dipeptidyl-peptidase 4